MPSSQELIELPSLLYEDFPKPLLKVPISFCTFMISTFTTAELAYCFAHVHYLN